MKVSEDESSLNILDRFLALKSNSLRDKCDAEHYPQTFHELFKTICYPTGAEKGIWGWSLCDPVHPEATVPFHSGSALLAMFYRTKHSNTAGSG